MTFALETAADPSKLRRVAIDPLSRVEGHGKVTLLLDGENRVQQARLHIVEFRGFEAFIEGRPYWEVPVMVQRLCGICPVSHHLAASKAMDRIVVSRRNIVGVAAAHPGIATQGVMLRKFGQEVIRATAGKRVHGTGSIPGGMNKHLGAADRRLLQADLPQVLDWARQAVAIVKQLHAAQPALYNGFASFRAPMMSLVANDGGMDLYDGVIRVRDAAGRIIVDGVADQDYLDLIEEEVKPWSYMKFPYLKSLGPGRGCRTATSSRARWPRPNAANSWPGARASRCTPRWPTTGRA